VTVLFLVVGLIMTGHAILTPLLMVIVMITGDFLSMSLTTDNVRPSPIPNAWRIGSLTMSGVIMGICLLAFCTGVLTIGRFEMNLGTEALRTLAFVVLVFGSQAMLYAIRQRRHLWGSRPSFWLAVSSIVDIVIASTLAVGGIAMTPIPASVVAGVLAAAVAFAFVLDVAKGSGICSPQDRVELPSQAVLKQLLPGETFPLILSFTVSNIPVIRLAWSVANFRSTTQRSYGVRRSW
jgi:H+-transporting ATPase